MAFGKMAWLNMADGCILDSRSRQYHVPDRPESRIEVMTFSGNPANRWRSLHLASIWSIVVTWSILVVLLAVLPHLRNPVSLGIALGAGSMIPHIWLGKNLWHDSKRTGIGMPIAILTLRFMGSLIIFSIFLWQFPAQQRIVALTGSSLIIVFTVIEAILFGKGVRRL